MATAADSDCVRTAVPPLRLRRATVSRAVPKYKISVLGLYSVGKTSLCRRFHVNEFTVSQDATIVVDFFSKNVATPDRVVGLNIFDTAGQERFGDIVQMMLHDIAGTLVVFALDKRASFDKAKTYVQRVREINPRVPVVLVGNKLDLVAPEECVVTGCEPAVDLALPSGTTPPPSPRSAARRERIDLSTTMASSFGDILRTRSRSRSRARTRSPSRTRARARSRSFAAAADAADAADADTDGNASTDTDDDGDGDGDAAIDMGGAGAVAGTPPRFTFDGGHVRARQISKREARIYARENNLSYVETSAMSDTNVTGAFRLLAEKIVADAYGVALSSETTAALQDDAAGAQPSLSDYSDVAFGDAVRNVAETSADLEEIERNLRAGGAPRRACCT